jgi:hypothetical protein
MTRDPHLLARQDRAAGDRQRRLGHCRASKRNQDAERQDDEQQTAPRGHRPSFAGAAASVSRERRPKSPSGGRQSGGRYSRSDRRASSRRSRRSTRTPAGTKGLSWTPRRAWCSEVGGGRAHGRALVSTTRWSDSDAARSLRHSRSRPCNAPLAPRPRSREPLWSTIGYPTARGSRASGRSGKSHGCATYAAG